MPTSVVQNQRVNAHDAAQMSKTEATRKSEAAARAVLQFENNPAKASPNHTPEYAGKITIV